MAKVQITNAAETAIRQCVLPGHDFVHGIQLPSGMWEVELTDDTLGRLAELALPSEPISDTICRIIATRKGYN